MIHLETETTIYASDSVNEGNDEVNEGNNALSDEENDKESKVEETEEGSAEGDKKKETSKRNGKKKVLGDQKALTDAEIAEFNNRIQRTGLVFLLL
jgi:hypothetical protein